MNELSNFIFGKHRSDFISSIEKSLIENGEDYS